MDEVFQNIGLRTRKAREHAGRVGTTNSSNPCLGGRADWCAVVRQPLSSVRPGAIWV